MEGTTGLDLGLLSKYKHILRKTGRDLQLPRQLTKRVYRPKTVGFCERNGPLKTGHLDGERTRETEGELGRNKDGEKVVLPKQ